MLIKMLDGGLVNYEDDFHYYPGCPTCDYGSEYITEIDITLTSYAVHVETSRMYDYAVSEGEMIKLFLSEYNTIQTMTEKEFIDWFKVQLIDIVGIEEIIDKFTVKEVKQNESNN